MSIPQEVIEYIKQTTDLVALIKSSGVKLRKYGNTYKGLCPFHSEEKPSFSVNVLEKLWHCFGCDKGGDAIKFVELTDNISFPKAVQKLGGDHVTEMMANTKPDNKKPKPPAKPATPKTKLIKLLNRCIEFGHTTFTEDNRAMTYLNKRGIDNNELFSDFKIGFTNGTLLNVLPNNGEVTNQLKELGILNSKGTELFYGCVTFPLYDLNGEPSGLYGRRLPEFTKGNNAEHLYLPVLPDSTKGLLNRQAASANKTIILTEAIIDSLTLINAGIKNAIPCFGTNGFTATHMDLLKQAAVETAIICFDADDSGRTAAKSLAQRLQSEGINAPIVNLPDGQDINDFFLLTANPAEAFQALIQQPETKAPETPTIPDTPVIKTEFGFTVTFATRSYEVRGITQRDSKLKATVKGIIQRSGKKRMHVDTVDFYAARSRLYLIKGLTDLFAENARIIEGDVQRLLEICESYQPEDAEKPDKEVMKEKDKESAMAFLTNPDLFSEILRDFEIVGYTGEETNKLLCYIAAISRKMDSPLSIMVQSRSGSGKTFLQDTALSLIPEEDYIKYTRLTDQVLFYKQGNSLAHKILAIEELDGMSGAIYSIRSIQSSKKITIAYTGKDKVTGELTACENTVEGPLMVFITTTQVEIDGETASRFLFVSIDETEAMTEKVLSKQRESHTMEGMLNKLKSSEIINKHQAANRLLKPLYVLNPYARLLTFNSKSLRARRDHTKYLNLILAITYLFQYQRTIHNMKYGDKTVEYVNVTLNDVEKANMIANEILGRCLDELPPPSKALLKLIHEMVMKHSKDRDIQPREYHFTRRDIRDYSRWSDFQIKTHIKQLEELEYLYAAIGRKGKEYVYELVITEELQENSPFLPGLINIEALKKKAEKAGITDDLEGGLPN